MTTTLKKYILMMGLALIGGLAAQAQPTIYPAKPQAESISIKGATIHVGNGQLIENGTLVFDKGKITYVGVAGAAPTAAETIDATGKHLYPGFIAPVTNLGLVEVEAVRATVDNTEIGDNNAHVRSLIAYNTDSKVINTLRSNGILLAQVTPEGGLITGQSSVVQLDAWNWEDAAYKTDDAIHINWPTVRYSRFGSNTDVEEQKQRISGERAQLNDFLVEAKAYTEDAKPTVFNARLAAFREVFDGVRKVMVHADKRSDIIAAVQLFSKFNLKPVIVGGTEAHLVTDFLKENDIAVIIHQAHSLPSNDDDDVNLPYKQAKILTDAGILVAYGMDGFWQQRNLPFMAGTAAAYGLDKEQALATITMNTAKILGLASTGSLEIGKDANLFISTGDALDMKGNNLEKAFIAGRDISLNNLHKQLFERYEYKYTP